MIEKLDKLCIEVKSCDNCQMKSYCEIKYGEKIIEKCDYCGKIGELNVFIKPITDGMTDITYHLCPICFYNFINFGRDRERYVDKIPKDDNDKYEVI